MAPGEAASLLSRRGRRHELDQVAAAERSTLAARQRSQLADIERQAS
jgi:hypothetical protein